MESLFEFLAAEDQQVARQLICAAGRELAHLNAKRARGVTSSTLVVMTPVDTDFFGEQFLYWLTNSLGNHVAPGKWAVRWANNYVLPTGVEVSAPVHQFISAEGEVSDAVVLCSLAVSKAEMRGLILFAVDQGVPLERVRVECPWMARSVYDHLCAEFGTQWGSAALADVGVMDDQHVNGVNLPQRLNLPDSSLTYLPALVRGCL